MEQDYQGEKPHDMENDNIPETEAPQEPPGNESKPFYKRLGILSYLRELSIVIIGILITLSITTLINNYSRQKELKGMLKLLKEELVQNLAEFRFVRNRYEGEQYVYSMLRSNMKDITRIPADTLEMYKYSLGALHSFTPRTDSYDVLLNSVLMQYIKERDLKYSLSFAYDQLSSFSHQIRRYSDQKTVPLDNVVTQMNEQELDEWLNGKDVYHYFNVPLSNTEFRAFLVRGGSIFDQNFMDICEQAVISVVADMEQNGY